MATFCMQVGSMLCRTRPVVFILFVLATQLGFVYREVVRKNRVSGLPTLGPPGEHGPIVSHKLHNENQNDAAHEKVSLSHLIQQVPEPTSTHEQTSRDNNTFIPTNKSIRLKKFKELYDIFRYENVNFKRYELNANISQTMIINGDIPDARTDYCKQQRHRVVAVGSKVSIIIPFHNELWAVLIRTLHSLLRHTPFQLLHEIILVDDCSTEENLGQPLTSYTAELPLTRLMRLRRRHGLIRARMEGARNASAGILVFLDAHVEVNVEWLEPLVQLVHKHPTTIALPVVEYIDPRTMAFYRITDKHKGLFDWDLEYVWQDTLDTFERDSTPFATATMIGCAFAVDRDNFFRLGGYDEEMNIWGGENIEISFRTWMCGGAMKIVPCSRVAHVYRARLPYAISDATVNHNLQRVAEVWMDDFKKHYYQTAISIAQFSQAERESILKRQRLRQQLKCKSFAWFLRQVAPDIVPPTADAAFFGHLKNVDTTFCLALTPGTSTINFEYCDFVTSGNLFTLSHSNSLYHKDQCVTAPDVPDGMVTMQPCDHSSHKQNWTFVVYLPKKYRKLLVGAEYRRPVGTFQLGNTNQPQKQCLSQEYRQGRAQLLLSPCQTEAIKQYWVFTHRIKQTAQWTDR